MFNQEQLLRQVEQMQRKMEKAQDELARQTVQGSAGGGVVVVTVTGQLVLQDVMIKPEAVDPDDVETLQDLVLTAVNDALTKAQDVQAKRMESVTGGLKIPGLM